MRRGSRHRASSATAGSVRHHTRYGPVPEPERGMPQRERHQDAGRKEQKNHRGLLLQAGETGGCGCVSREGRSMEEG